MKKLVLVLVILGIAAAIGYLLGTESGRARRDDVLSRLRKAADDTGEPEIDLREAASDVVESGAEIADKVVDAVGTTG